MMIQGLRILNWKLRSRNYGEMHNMFDALILLLVILTIGELVLFILVINLIKSLIEMDVIL